jgi:hypothetical protein
MPVSSRPRLITAAVGAGGEAWSWIVHAPSLSWDLACQERNDAERGDCDGGAGCDDAGDLRSNGQALAPLTGVIGDVGHVGTPPH